MLISRSGGSSAFFDPQPKTALRLVHLVPAKIDTISPRRHRVNAKEPDHRDSIAMVSDLISPSKNPTENSVLLVT